MEEQPRRKINGSFVEFAAADGLLRESVNGPTLLYECLLEARKMRNQVSISIYLP